VKLLETRSLAKRVEALQAWEYRGEVGGGTAVHRRTGEAGRRVDRGASWRGRRDVADSVDRRGEGTWWCPVESLAACQSYHLTVSHVICRVVLADDFRCVRLGLKG
jgi:hypothetical protein